MKGNDRAIQNASAWVLRIGVVTSVLVMLTGVTVSFIRQVPTVEEMQTKPFGIPGMSMWQGLLAGRGRAITELGMLLLVLTPIARVATSMVLFWAVERDWFYTLVTAVVLAITLASLLWLG